jgi:hypothetical protein
MAIVLFLGVLALPLTPPPAAAQPTAPYSSPLRAQCEAELARDARWSAELRDRVRPEVHQEDAQLMLVNKRHVVLAYGVLWAMVAGTVLLMWLRQRRLQEQIAQLERDLERAARDG